MADEQMKKTVGVADIMGGKSEKTVKPKESKPKADAKSKKTKHKHTHIEHHADGSHTVHHEHEDGSMHDVKHAVADLDGMHDSMQDHLGTPNPGEAEANEGSEAAAAGAAPAAAGM